MLVVEAEQDNCNQGTSCALLRRLERWFGARYPKSQWRVNI